MTGFAVKDAGGRMRAIAAARASPILVGMSEL
jgi:hypothetical protein